jgi:hypothetical protein
MEIIGRCMATGCSGRVHYDLDGGCDMVGALGMCDGCASVYRLAGGQDRPVSGPALRTLTGAGVGDLDLRTAPLSAPARG